MSKRRLGCAVLLVAIIPLAVEMPALATFGILTGILATLVAFETLRYSESRERIRRRLVAEAAAEAD